MVNDKQDNLYIAGSADHRTKYVILKYNHSGALQWANISDADNPPLSKPAKIAVDDSGNVFMVSRTGDILKYDTDGNQIWYQKDNHDERYTMALDNNSNIYVAGTDLVTKYNSDGVKQWEVIDTLYIYYQYCPNV